MSLAKIMAKTPMMRVVESLNKSYIDVFTSYAYTKKRTDSVDFIKHTLFKSWPSISVKNNFKSIKKKGVPDYLFGKTILLSRGVIIDRYFKKFKSIDIKTISYVGDYSLRALKILRNRHVDFVFLPSVEGLKAKIDPYSVTCSKFGNKAIFKLSVKKGSELKNKLEKLNILTYKPDFIKKSRKKFPRL